MCDLHFKFEEDRTKTAVAVESDRYSFGQTHTSTDFIGPTLSSAMNCIGQTKTLKVCYKVSLSKNFKRQGRSAVNYLSNGINLLARDDPFTVKFGPKGTDPNRKDELLRFTRGALCSQR